VQAKSTTNYPTYDLLVNSMSAGASLGKEFRHSLSHKLFIRYGIELSFSYDHNYYKSLANEHEDFKYSPGINLLGGILYSISDNLVLGFYCYPISNIKPERIYQMELNLMSQVLHMD